MRLRTGIIVAFVGTAFGCSNGSAPHSMLPPEEPMLLAFSDGSEYPARARLRVSQDRVTGEARFALNVTAVVPGDHEMPGVGAPIAADDARILFGAVTSGGASIPYGEGLLFNYTSGDTVVHRTPSTLRLWIDGASTHIEIQMAEAVPIGSEDVSELAPSASATLVGQLSVSCVMPESPGSGFTTEDPTWTHELCRSIADEYGLEPLLAIR